MDEDAWSAVWDRLPLRYGTLCRGASSTMRGRMRARKRAVMSVVWREWTLTLNVGRLVRQVVRQVLGPP